MGRKGRRKGSAPPFLILEARLSYAASMRYLLFALSIFGISVPAYAPQSAPVPVPIEPAKWFTSDDLSCSWSGCGEDGTISFIVYVTKAGKVAACRITEKSGSARLDKLTCRILTKRARFKPAIDEDGKPVFGTYRSAVKWTHAASAD